MKFSRSDFEMQRFDPETIRVMGLAFEMAPAALRLIDRGDFANELLLGGQRVLPNKALSNGFKFRHETLRSAFEAIL